ncbi:P-loop containing nucleoside triphosphate hydrolase protein [Butyriboletus roseoflavus]|nr:P-loop containing nucleoside triphosphate hydrolase protein [Butyriboletus roseoflavus]
MGQSPSAPTKSIPSKRCDGQSPRNTTGTGQASTRASALEEGPAPPYESTYSATNHLEWNDCDVLVWTRDEQKEVSTLPQNPFIFGGATPASTRPKTVVIFGETGVGKSSVINLMAGAEVAATSANLEGCTMHATEYSFSLPGERSFRVYDTVGLNEPEMGVNTFFGAIEKAHQLITSLHHAGGIDLLLFCIRGGRNHRHNATQLSLVFRISDVMETWWDKNERIFQSYDMHSVAHACITAVPPRVTMFAEKRAESQGALREMLHNSSSEPNSPYVKDARSWFASMISQLRLFLMKSLSLEKKDLSKRLQTRCELSRDDAKQLADMLTER